MATSKKIFLNDAGGDLSKRWYLEWYEDGQRVRKYAGMNHINDVAARRAAALQLIEQYSAGEQAPQLADALWGEMETRRKLMRAKAWQTYASRVKIFLAWAKEQRIHRREDVTATSIDLFYAYLLKSGRKAGTVDGYKTTLSALLGAELVKQAHAPTFTHEPARRFSKADRLRLAGYLAHHDPELWLFIQFVYYCFVRPRTELRLLTVDCLLLDEKQLIIPASLSKSKKTRYVPIPGKFAAELQNRTFPGPYLFGGAKPYGHNTMAVRHMKHLVKLGLSPREYKLYSWRHTAAVDAAKNNVPIKILQLWMGHSSPDITDKYLRQLGVNDSGDYTHLVDVMG